MLTSMGHAYWINLVAYTDEQTGANAEVGTHYFLGANYQMVKEIELPSPTKIYKVYNQLKSQLMVQPTVRSSIITWMERRRILLNKA